MWEVKAATCSLSDINQAALGSGNIDDPITGSNVSSGTAGCPAGYTYQNCSRPFFSQFPDFTFINEIQSIGTSNYNALQATLKVRGFHGLTAQAA